MTYVLDTNIIRTFLTSFPKKGRRYEEVWITLDEMIKEGSIISVDECYNELKRQLSDNAEQFKWIDEHKGMFKNPTNEESIIISKLFADAKIRETVHLKNILDNRPSADAYIAAKAKSLNATVVTKEKWKPHSAQLPNLCEKLSVKCISYDDFMEIIG